MSVQKSRPTGVTILVVLQIIGAIFALLGGLALLGLAAVPGVALRVGARLDALLLLAGLVLTFAGAINLFLSWGLWGGKRWAWTWTLILSVISIIFSVVQMIQGHFFQIIGLLLQLLVIYYLNTPHVKTFFGKSQQSVSPPPPLS